MLGQTKEYVSSRALDASFSFANSDDVSEMFDMCGCTLIGVRIPDEFLGTTLTLLSSHTETGSLVEVHNSSGNVVTITVEAGGYYRFDTSDTYGERYIALKSDVAQTEDVVVIANAVGY